MKHPRCSGFTRYYWRLSARSLDGSSTSAYSAVRYYTTVLDTPALIVPDAGPDRPACHHGVPVEAHRVCGDLQTGGLQGRFISQPSRSSTRPALDTARVVGPLEGHDHLLLARAGAEPGRCKRIYDTCGISRRPSHTPILLLPANAEQFAPLSPTLSWSDVPGAARYRVQVATDSLMTQVVVDDSLVATTSRSVGPLPTAAETLLAGPGKIRRWTEHRILFPGLVVQNRATSAVGDLRSLHRPTILLDQSRTVQLKWRRGSGAETYGLQIGNGLAVHADRRR